MRRKRTAGNFLCEVVGCNGTTMVYDSRSQHENTRIWRRRKCVVCGWRFTTIEISKRALTDDNEESSETPGETGGSTTGGSVG